MTTRRRRDGALAFLLFLGSILMLFFATKSPVSADAATEVIIDNGGAGTSYTGTWAVSGALNPYGKDSVYGRGGATYTWKANLPQTGVYEVYVWWTEYSSRSTNAPVKITHSGGADTVRVNQQVNGGKWSYLGTYSFDAAAGGTVMLTAESPSPVSYSADAVKFVLVNGGNLPPIAVIDSLSPNPARTGDTVTFTGHGTDSDGTVTGYNWRSSIDGNLGTTASFTTATLSGGVHTIYFRVQDNTGAWSPEVDMTLTVSKDQTSFEVIIDNGGAGTSYTGTWAVSGAPNPYGRNSLYSRETATYTWHASLPQTGVYEVYVWWTEYSSRATDAPLKVIHSGGTDTIRVNQQVNGGKWNYLGTYSFDASAGGTVTLTAGDASNHSFSADAVKFVLVSGGNLPPIAVIDSLSPNPASTGDTVTFTGHGTDSDGTVTGYNWRSSIDGNLGTAASFSTSALSEGTHTIFFTVQDNAGDRSPEVSKTLTVSPSSPPVEVIIDNGGAGTSYTGTWAVSGALNPYGKDSVYGRGGATYTWKANLPQTGVYEVYVWWTEYSSRSTNAPVKITHSGGADTVRVNQQVNGGKWSYLGTYSFDAAAGGTVMLTAESPSPVSYSADAVKFVLVNGGNLPPIAVIDSLSPNPARTGDTVTFTGHGTDSDGTVTGYNWRSSIDGNLGTEASLSTAGLTPGTHTIFFKVNDDDGAWSPEVSADLSVDQFPSEIIVDNGDAGTSSTGLWKVSGAPNPYGKDSLYSRETATYTWHADLPQAGAYEVYVWWTEYSSRSDYAPVTIQYDNGSEVVRVNQQVNGGKWNYLGTYSFDTVKGGTVTLTSGDPYADSYSADAVKFVYTDQPFVGIVRPQSYDLQGGTSLTAKAEARNVQGGWKVQFILDRDTPGEQAITDGTDPYEVTFTGLTKGEHTLDALLLDAADKEVPGTFTRDRNIQIGVGDYYVAMGDSITYGDSDDYPQDDISNDGRNSGGGYEPILNSLRTAYLGYSQTVINEGVNATRSYNGASSAGGILAKHPDAKYFLIMYGTNDSASKIPSGLGLQPGSQGYANSYKDYMQRIITAVLDTGKVPVIAKIPVVYGDCPSCTRYADPQNASRNVLIREYNKVIDELVKENKLTIQGPDMYAYFSVYPEEFSDTTHPNGKGYQSMADLWHDALP